MTIITKIIAAILLTLQITLPSTTMYVGTVTSVSFPTDDIDYSITEITIHETDEIHVFENFILPRGSKCIIIFDDNNEFIDIISVNNIYNE